MSASATTGAFRRKPDEHRLLAEHLTSEYRVKTEGRGRVIDEWKLRAHKPDSQWLDCLERAMEAIDDLHCLELLEAL